MALRTTTTMAAAVLAVVPVLAVGGTALTGCGERIDLLGTLDSPPDAAPPADGAAPWPPYIIGADVSYAQQDEDSGEQFHDTDGTPAEILQILKNHGFNFIRLRTFVDPGASDGYASMLNLSQPYCDLAHTITMGKRIKDAGMGFHLDFHYSDNWADTGKQVIPLAWQGSSLAQMVTLLHDYTKDAVTQLVAAGARPDMVQIGNEITPGLLLSPGPVSGSTGDWPALAMFLGAGVAAVREVDSTIKVMMHLDLGGDNAGARAWVDSALANGVDFDVLGLSCYTNVQGPPATWQANFDDLIVRYPNLQFMIVEYSESSADLSGTVDVWRQTNDIMFTLPRKGLGTFVWEPTAWQETLFDNQGRTSAADLPNPFVAGSPRITLYDQMASDYGLR